MAVKGLELLPVLHARGRNVDLDKKKAPDDIFDAINNSVRFVSDRWIKSGLVQEMCAGRAEATVRLALPNALGRMAGQSFDQTLTASKGTRSLDFLSPAKRKKENSY